VPVVTIFPKSCGVRKREAPELWSRVTRQFTFSNLKGLRAAVQTLSGGATLSKTRRYGSPSSTVLQVLEIIRQLAINVEYSPTMNERHLHHVFSHHLQNRICPISIAAVPRNQIHPEWPTARQTPSLSFGRYTNTNGAYQADSKGSAGFIDFAIGDYESPAVGIEFVLMRSWSKESVVFDFLKLLDPANPFESVFSFNLILRDKGVATGGHKTNLEQSINDAYSEAHNRLNGGASPSRQVFFIVAEIDPANERHFWHYRGASGGFIIGLP